MEGDELLTVAEVAAILRVDVSTVRRWIAQHTLEAFALPRQSRRKGYFIEREVLDRLLNPANKPA